MFSWSSYDVAQRLIEFLHVNHWCVWKHISWRDRFDVIDFDFELFFEIVVDSFGLAWRIHVKLEKNFDRNKFLIHIDKIRMIQIMIKVSLNRLSNTPNDAARENSWMKMSRAFLGFAVRRKALWIDFFEDECETSRSAVRPHMCLKFAKISNFVSMTNLEDLCWFWDCIWENISYFDLRKEAEKCVWEWEWLILLSVK